MDRHEFGDSIHVLDQCIDALITLQNRPHVHGMDNGMLSEHLMALFSERSRLLREFEEACIGRGEAAATAFQNR